MNEYRIAVPKGDVTGFASDPNQNVSNASGFDLNTPLTAQNIVNIAVLGTYGKKVLGAGYKAIVGQFGNSRLEEAIEVGTQVLTYVGIGIVSGPSAVFTVPTAILADIATSRINSLVLNHETKLENERIVEERGGLLQYGVGGYFG